MNEIEKMLKELGRKTMFDIHDEDMPALVEEYHIFMNHVQVLETIDTSQVEPLAFPYEITTHFLREDNVCYTLSRDDALKNAKDIQDYQVKVQKVVG